MEDLFGQELVDKYVNSGYSYNLYKRLLRQKYPGEKILLRRFVSDAYDFKTIEKMYEEKDPDQPMFLFNVTMQNHSSYNQKYDNFEQEVYLTSTKGDYPKTDQYLSLIKKTDEAFEELLNYFKTVDDLPFILMFGDHQPFIEDSFYSEVMGQSISEMDGETQQKRYITRFILWANYDIPTGWVDEISMNYLGTLLTQVSGLQMTKYNQYLAGLYTKLPVITAMAAGMRRETFSRRMKKIHWSRKLPATETWPITIWRILKIEPPVCSIYRAAPLLPELANHAVGESCGMVFSSVS